VLITMRVSEAHVGVDGVIVIDVTTTLPPEHDTTIESAVTLSPVMVSVLGEVV